MSNTCDAYDYVFEPNACGSDDSDSILVHSSLSTALAEKLNVTVKEDELNEESSSFVAKSSKKKSVQFVDSCEASSANTWSDAPIDSISPQKAGYRVTFEIISAKTVNCPRSSAPKRKYVSYTILVKRIPGLETRPGIIERRYTDFLALYLSLKKRFQSLLNDFPFPKKTIVGNFSPETITERSVAFQHLLAFCLTVSELRRTQEFHDFLYSRELKEARRLMKCSQFEESSNLLENVYFIQEKLILQDSEFSSTVFRILCVLTACLNAVNNINEAQEFAEKALLIAEKQQCINGELYAALIVLSKKLFWSLQKQSSLLDSKLSELRQKGLKVDNLPTLLEIVMKKDFTLVSI